MPTNSASRVWGWISRAPDPKSGAPSNQARPEGDGSSDTMSGAHGSNCDHIATMPRVTGRDACPTRTRRTAVDQDQRGRQGDGKDRGGRVMADYGSGGWGFESLAARQTPSSEPIKQEKLVGADLARGSPYVRRGPSSAAHANHQRPGPARITWLSGPASRPRALPWTQALNGGGVEPVARDALSAKGVSPPPMWPHGCGAHGLSRDPLRISGGRCARPSVLLRWTAVRHSASAGRRTSYVQGSHALSAGCA
jgi:hypothetical protein